MDLQLFTPASTSLVSSSYDQLHFSVFCPTSPFITRLLTATNFGLTLTWPQFIYFNSPPGKWTIKFRGCRWSDPTVRVKVCVICEQKPIALIGAGDPQCHLSSVPLLLPPCPCYARRLRRYICLLNTCTNLPAAMEPCEEARWEDGNAAVSPVLCKVNLIFSCNYHVTLMKPQQTNT